MPQASRVVASVLLVVAAAVALARERSLPVSAYRRYFWGAREAFDRREFKRAQSLLDTYKDVGSPSDRLVKQSGCDPKQEVAQFTALLKETRTCMAHRRTSAHWMNTEQAKLAIQKAFESGDAQPLSGYLDCALLDLTSQENACPSTKYAASADWPRFIAAIHSKPDIYKEPDWREFPPHWVLYPVQPQWKPCGMPGAPLVSLRQDPNGQLRIAGFAASCL